MQDLINSNANIVGVTLNSLPNDFWSADIRFSRYIMSQTGQSEWHDDFFDEYHGYVPGTGWESKDLGAVFVGKMHINLGFWNEGADIVGAIGTITELGIGTAEWFGFRKGEWWFSWKKLKFYDWNFQGNGYTGGKIKSSGSIHNVLKWTGRALAVKSAYDTFSDLKNGDISFGRASLEWGVTGYSTFGPYGFSIAIGWEGGRWLTSRTWYRRNVRVGLQQAFGVLDDESQQYILEKMILNAPIPNK